jgi:hypothetical protein
VVERQRHHRFSSAEKTLRSQRDRSRGEEGLRFTADEQGRGVEARWAKKAFCADSVSQLVMVSLRDKVVYLLAKLTSFLIGSWQIAR